MLLRLLSSLFRSTHPPQRAAIRIELAAATPCVLDVGSGSREIPLPLHYAGWTRCLLDIDPATRPDVVLDARELTRLEPGLFDAVYCSHNLEHYHAHEVPMILRGFRHVMKAGGFVEIRVPDIAAVAREISAPGRELNDVLYTSPAGPITARDVIYGYERWIAKSGEDFFAHKTGFTRHTLGLALREAGFEHQYWLAPFGPFEIRAIATRSPADQSRRKLLGLGEATASANGCSPPGGPP